MTALSLEQEIATYLDGETLSTDLVLGTNLFYSTLPDEPDLCVGILSTGGSAAPLFLTGPASPGPALTEPNLDIATFQVSVRAGMTDFATGHALAQSVYKALQGLFETVLNGSPNALFHLIRALQPPHYLGRGLATDPRERHRWTQNYQTIWDNPAR